MPTDFDAVPLRVTLAGKELALEAELWRNGWNVGPEGSSLAAFMRIKTVDGSPVPNNIRADAAWLRQPDDLWSTLVIDQWPRTQTLPFFEVSAREGPEWPGGTSVVVVIRVRETNGRRYLLRAPVTMVGIAS
jgi:hypothetical protein